ncbi:MAG: ABC transporter permease [Lachnospiraceae bacterium]|nr:ABC transporter permease [Lachnospiraceae bacterium]
MGFFTAGIVQTALEVGLIYSLIALSLFLSFSILNICDLSTDGCYTLGCAVGATMTIAGHPVLGIVCAMAAGACSGFVTASLQTVFGVPSILAGIIVNTGLYTVNLAVMGFSSNLSIFGKDTVFSMIAGLSDAAGWGDWSALVLLLVLVGAACLLLWWFLGTRLGLSIRATGDSSPMVRASSINPGLMITIGLCVSNSLTGMAGALIAQYNKMADINLGTGMVTIALASLIIGETLFGRGKMPARIAGVVAGAVLYRFIMAIALRLNVPTEAFKLVSALIVAVAIAAPAAKEMLRFQMEKRIGRRTRARADAGDNPADKEAR